MPHTQSRYQQDLGFTDGLLVLSDFAIVPTGTGAPTVPTRNGVGDISWNIGAAVGPINYSMNLANGRLFRSGFGEDLQEQFGGAGIPASAQFQGRPDTIGAMSALQQITPRTALKLKGIQINSINLIYLITGAALTTHTCRLDKSAFANNVALASTSVLASAANGLQTAIQANPYCTEIAMPASFQVYQISDLSEYWFEVTATTQAAGAYRLYGARAKVTFNFN